MIPLIQKITRRLRSLSGLGWSGREFRHRYAKSPGNSWGYLASASHEWRLLNILEKLPDNPKGTILEAGCAEGFITRHLMQRYGRVIACDLSDLAVERARACCPAAKHVEFHCLDIRRGIPARDIDVCLASNVLYYLSPREITAFAAELASRMNASGTLVFANEWNNAYRDLMHPEKACRSIVASGRWKQTSLDEQSTGRQSAHWTGIFALEPEL